MIRIGLDVAGGAANFAATVKPMNELVAARGMFPLLLLPAHPDELFLTRCIF